MTSKPADAGGEILFGPYRLLAAERLLLKDDEPVELGARALDMLFALASRPNEVISKRDLIAQVWPDVVVEEGSLRFHIAALRKALGDGKDGAHIDWFIARAETHSLGPYYFMARHTMSKAPCASPMTKSRPIRFSSKRTKHGEVAASRVSSLRSCVSWSAVRRSIMCAIRR
jgi:hypothetical protein